MNFPPELKTLLDQIAPALQSSQKVYLVGGVVRDLLLNRPTHDIDFVIEGDVFAIARKVANHLKAAFYIMDVEHGIARVIHKDEHGERTILDFNILRGQDLESDLRTRDFRINALAFDYKNDKLIDPLLGARDLKDKILEVCSERSIQDDPLRILRGVRFALDLNLKMSPLVRKLIVQSVPGLANISSERVRDELFRIFEGHHPESAIRLLDIFGALPFILPELLELKGVTQSPPHVMDVWNHSLACVKYLNIVLEVLKEEFNPEIGANFAFGYISGMLGRYRLKISEHLSRRLNIERSYQSILVFSALYHDIAKPQNRSIEPDGRIRFLQHEAAGGVLAKYRAEQLHLSNPEINFIQTFVRNHMRPLLLAKDPVFPSPRSVYRYFRDLGEVGIDIGLFALADTLAIYQHTLPRVHWIHLVEVVRKLFEAYWEEPVEKVRPLPILNGNEIMQRYNLKPGPMIGMIIEALLEAQVEGKVLNREQAFELIQQILEQQDLG